MRIPLKNGATWFCVAFPRTTVSQAFILLLKYLMSTRSTLAAASMFAPGAEQHRIEKIASLTVQSANGQWRKGMLENYAGDGHSKFRERRVLIRRWLVMENILSQFAVKGCHPVASLFHTCQHSQFAWQAPKFQLVLPIVWVA